MFKLFIVDDEVERIEAIKTLIPWSDYQIEICGEADNGLTAYKEIKNSRPDIVISDIRMPGMDGLELFKKLKHENIVVKGIILSGYDDFEYAKKAINLNVIEYLLKPCRPQEIIEAAVKAKNVLEEEQKNNRYRVSYDEILLEKRKEFLRELTIGTKVYTEDIENKFLHYNIKKKSGKSFSAIIFSVDNKSKITDHKKLQDAKENIVNQCKKHFSEETLIEWFENSHDIIIIILIDKGYFNSKAFLDSLNRIKENVNISITVGIGMLVNEIKEINQSFNSAAHAVEAKFFLGKDRIINLNDLYSYKDMVGFYPLNEEQDIINCLDTGNKESIISKVDNFYRKLCSDEYPSKSFLQKITISFCSRIYKFCIDKNISVKDTFESELKAFDKIEECETMAEQKTYLCSILNTIIDKINEGNKKNVIITKAVEYIMKNYTKDISLEVISKQLYISPGYLSLLFKQEMGVNFIDFISNYRIEKSKELLKNNSYKTYQVAKLVGFSDEKYFSQLFKKLTGLTPTQYRQK